MISSEKDCIRQKDFIRLQHLGVYNLKLKKGVKTNMHSNEERRQSAALEDVLCFIY